MPQILPKAKLNTPIYLNSNDNKLNNYLLFFDILITIMLMMIITTRLKIDRSVKLYEYKQI